MEIYKYLFIVILYSFALTVQGQDIIIEGYLFDKNNEPVIGAVIILEDNQKIGTVSDADGGFSLAVPYEYQGRCLIVKHFESFQDKKVVINTSYNKPFKIIRLDDIQPFEIPLIITNCYPVEVDYSFWDMIKNPQKPKNYLLGTIASPASFLKTREIISNHPPLHKRVWGWLTRPFR